MTNYENFVFYGAIRESVDSLPEDVGNRLLRAIMNFGTAGELPDPKDTIVYAVMMGYIPNITNARKRYEINKANGKSGGAQKQYSDTEIETYLKSGMGIKEVAERIGCSTKTVQRVKAQMKHLNEEDDEI